MAKIVNIEDFKPRPPEFSDEALALGFTERHGADWRYTQELGHWSHFDGACWRKDSTRLARDLARAYCREISAAAPTPKVAHDVASKKTGDAVEALARVDRRHAAVAAQWDADPWLLGTPGGTYDLRLGRLREARRDDYISKTAAVAPGGECPIWRQFLDRVTDSDAQLQLFLQRMAGYAATGSTREHALFFLFGTGANGKSVFITTISGVLGDYATTAPMETFVASKYGADRHPTELAGLAGARLVTAVETEDGRRWNESRISALTGEDKISARFMKQDFFDYSPQFKLVIAGNHKPGLRGVGEAMRRRVNLVPWGVTIPKDERDDGLVDRLKAEWPGILQWIVDGCVEWQGEGLAPPEAVRAATEGYFEDEDALGQWMDERCVVKSGFTATASDLFTSWRRWAEQAGEYVGSTKRFSQRLLDRGPGNHAPPRACRCQTLRWDWPEAG